MRERRNGLRPVTIIYTSRLSGVTTKEEGYFHCFQNTQYEDGMMRIVAMVEMKDGSIRMWEPEDMKFDDVI